MTMTYKHKYEITLKQKNTLLIHFNSMGERIEKLREEYIEQLKENRKLEIQLRELKLNQIE